MRLIEGDPRKPATTRTGLLEQFKRSPLLLDFSITEQHDAVGQRHRLDLIVGDVDHRRRDFVVQALDLGPHLIAQLGVEV